jgi:chromate transport protein ChrA
MWAATQTLEKELVHRRGWLEREELETLYVVATLIPAPRFMGLAGLVGFKVAHWSGSLLAIVTLVLPTSLLVLGAAVFMSPQLLHGVLEPLNRSVSVAVVGLLFGNAYVQLRQAVARGRRRTVGLSLTVATFAAIALGAPLVTVAVVSFAVGSLVIKEERGLQERLDALPEVTDG